MGLFGLGRDLRRFGLVLALLLTAPLSARAIEYRLEVVNVENQAFVSFLGRHETGDGASGPGLERLERSLDRGALTKAALLFDRHLMVVPDIVAAAWGAAPVRGEVRLGGFGRELWDEVRWDGQPGQRTVWAIVPASRQPQEVRRVALKGPGPLRHFQVYGASLAPAPGPVARLPIVFLRGDAPGEVWERHLSRHVSFTEGVAVVVGANNDPMFPDTVYIVVNQGDQTRRFRVVVAWRRRDNDREAPGVPSVNPLR